MSNQNFSSIDLFLRRDIDPGSPELTNIIVQYSPSNKQVNGRNVSFELNDSEFDVVRDLMQKLLPLLDGDKRSFAIVINNFKVRSIVAIGGVLS